MISIIITSKNEAKTISQAVGGFLDENYLNQDFEIIIVAPDKETLNVAKNIPSDDKIKTIQDQNKGKPEALNLALEQAKGDILIFSDGDVFIEKGAVGELLKEIQTGAVTGRPISLASPNPGGQNSPKQSRLQFWSETLVNEAHCLRQQKSEKKEFLLLSGYLFAVKKQALGNFKFPENCLTEDEYLSYYLWHKNYKIKYAGNAKVNVKFSDNYSDWIKQKTRTLAGSYQIPKDWKQGIEMRSFFKESKHALNIWRRYPKNLPKHQILRQSRRLIKICQVGGLMPSTTDTLVLGLQQKYWLTLLFLARLHVWFLAFVNIKLLKKNRQELWKRIPSTK